MQYHSTFIAINPTTWTVFVANGNLYDAHIRRYIIIIDRPCIISSLWLVKLKEANCQTSEFMTFGSEIQL